MVIFTVPHVPWNLKPIPVPRAHMPKLMELLKQKVEMGILKPSSAIQIGGLPCRSKTARCALFRTCSRSTRSPFKTQVSDRPLTSSRRPSPEGRFIQSGIYTQGTTNSN